MKFKNLNTESGKFSFNGIRIEFNGIFETEDKELINFLKGTQDFVCVDEVKEDESSDELEELKKQADELGLDYHPKIGLEKLQKKIDEHLDK